MTAIDKLIEKATELDKDCRSSFDPAIREVAGIDVTIKALLDIAIDLQKQLSDMIIIRFEPPLPIDQEKEEDAGKEDEAGSIQNDYLINLGLINFYPLSEVIRDTFKTFDVQTSEIFKIFSPDASLEKPQSTEPKIIDIQISEGKLSTYDKTVSPDNEFVYDNLKKSALVVNELRTICDSFADVSFESISSDAASNISSKLFEETRDGTEDIKKNEILDFRKFSDTVHYFSEVARDSARSMYARISKLQETADVLSLDRMLAEHSEPVELIEDFSKITYAANGTFQEGIPQHDAAKLELSEMTKIITSLDESISQAQATKDILSFNTVSTKNLQEISRLSEITKMIASLDEGISQTLMTKDISSFNTISIKSLQEVSELSEITKMIASSYESISQAQAIKYTSSLSTISTKSLKEASGLSEMAKTISTLNKSISEAQNITGIPSLGASTEMPAEIETIKPAIYPEKRIFEIPALKPKMITDDAAVNTARLSGAISKASIEKGTVPVFGKLDSSPNAIASSVFNISNAFEVISDYITTASAIDRQMNEIAGEGIDDVNKITWQHSLSNLMLSDGGSSAINLDGYAAAQGTTDGVQMMSIAFDMASAGASERLSAMNNIHLASSHGGDYRVPLPITPYPVENIMQVISNTQREKPHSANNSVNFQNTFNIVVNSGSGGKETELKELGRKIGQILSDEIRRYGGIR